MTRFSRRSTRTAVALLAVTLLGSTAPALADDGLTVEAPVGDVSALAAADRPDFQLPFPCDFKARLTTYPGHDDYDIDMWAADGESKHKPILASADGTVTVGEWQDGAGNIVIINHGGGWTTSYMHLAERPLVREGDKVKQGQLIGKLGNTGANNPGRSYHLHYEQNLNRQKTEAHFNGSPSGIRDDGASTIRFITSANCGGGQRINPAQIYGVMKTGELYYAVVDAKNGKRTHTVRSTLKLDFIPKAIAALNFNTLLVTSPSGGLHRIDVKTNKTTLNFTVSGELEKGWTHDLLTFDGGYLYGIADGVLSRYVVSREKPGSAQIGSRQQVGKGAGWALSTLTATAPGWLLAVSNSGDLLSYRINTKNAKDPWDRFVLKDGGWGTVNQLVSSGDGYYLGRADNGSLGQYVDADPYDGKGGDLKYGKDIDAKGWTQHLITAVPNFND